MTNNKTIVGMHAVVPDSRQPDWALPMARQMNQRLRAEVNRLEAALGKALTENMNLRLVIAHHGITADDDVEVEYVG